VGVHGEHGALDSNGVWGGAYPADRAPNGLHGAATDPEDEKLLVHFQRGAKTKGFK